MWWNLFNIWTYVVHLSAFFCIQMIFNGFLKKSACIPLFFSRKVHMFILFEKSNHVQQMDGGADIVGKRDWLHFIVCFFHMSLHIPINKIILHRHIPALRQRLLDMKHDWMIFREIFPIPPIRHQFPKRHVFKTCFVWLRICTISHYASEMYQIFK